ncbi:response regulator [Cryobacterium sp. 1639]|uniref:response regulator n=1 Tax=Cryobacterium inferilacus TaxID=2866629 RepID=UPI001C732CA0|nr:response regulator [Cryobacterium sp. 1639]MBX0300314.1 response regulator [Cryobacterium sp. 1639]
MRAPGTIRTLVVDDDASVCGLHVRYLTALAGFTVVGTAATGAEAVDFVAATEVDLVLLDMHLPDFSGIEVLHRLRSLSHEELAVIVVTSANEAVTVRQAAAAAVADYLVKPFSRSVFELRLTAYRAASAAAAASPGGAGALRQTEIDGLLRPARSAQTVPTVTGPVAPIARLPKGLAAPTVARVLQVLRDREVSSATDVAGACGLARGTARRYLEYLRLSGQAIVTHRYGVRGRPELLYSVAPG